MEKTQEGKLSTGGQHEPQELLDTPKAYMERFHVDKLEETG